MTDQVQAAGTRNDTIAALGRARYAEALGEGRLAEPRAGLEVAPGGPRFAGCVALGPSVPRGRFHVREIRFVEEARVLSLAPRFGSRAEAEAFGRRMALRYGPRLGVFHDEGAMLGLEAWLWSGRSWPRPSATADGIREALAEHLGGLPLDETRIYGTEPPFEDVLTCADGSTWRRVLTLEGAVRVTHGCLDETACQFEYAAAKSESGRPDDAFHCLVTGEEGARYVVATVRVPGSPRGETLVNGVLNKDPFPRFGVHIAELAARLGVRLEPRHYPYGHGPVGDAEAALGELSGV